jgi:hypothetical protein
LNSCVAIFETAHAQYENPWSLHSCREQVQRFEPNISEDDVLKKMFSRNFHHIVVVGK